MSDYSIWLVQNAQCSTFPKGLVYLDEHNSGTIVLPFCFVVIKGLGHVSLVDTGLNYGSAFGHHQAELWGITDWRDPRELLRFLEITPEDVDTIVITHAHWDHLGNLEAFPNATVYIQEEELKNWVGALSQPDRFARLREGVDPKQLQLLIDFSVKGKVRLVSGRMQNVLPGIDLRPAYEAHSFASQYVIINNSERNDAVPWVIPGDCVFSFGNIEGLRGSGVYRPYGNYMSLRRVFEVFDEIVALVRHQTSRVIPMHDSEVWNRFPSRKTFAHLHLAEIALAHGEKSYIKDL